MFMFAEPPILDMLPGGPGGGPGGCCLQAGGSTTAVSWGVVCVVALTPSIPLSTLRGSLAGDSSVVGSAVQGSSKWASSSSSSEANSLIRTMAVVSDTTVYVRLVSVHSSSGSPSSKLHSLILTRVVGSCTVACVVLSFLNSSSKLLIRPL